MGETGRKLQQKSTGLTYLHEMNCEVCATEFIPRQAGQKKCGRDACHSKAKRAIRKEKAKVEWYTPSYITDAARIVMGGIDLDPASSVAANETVGAETIYTITDRGETKPWRGRVWMNPPYGKQGPVFCDRLRKELKANTVSAACVLLSVNMMSAGWFRWMLDDGIVCIHEKRVHFVRGKQTRDVPHGSVIIGLGQALNQGLFHAQFSPMGAILKRRYE